MKPETISLIYSIALLVASNFFMLCAWYLHLRVEFLKNQPLLFVILISWGIAFFEYLIQVPANRIVLLGESLGGGPAVELATRHDHRALVLVFTFTSLPTVAKVHYRMLPTQLLMRTRFDNLAKIGRCRRPVFIAHGTADDVVPFAHGEALFAAANEPKEFLRLEGFGHDLALGDRLCVPLAQFLARHAP